MIRSLELMHANAAILTMVGQRAVDAVAEMKFQSIKKSSVKLGDNQSFRVKKESKPEEKAQAAVEMTQIEKGVAVSFQGQGGKSKKRFPPEVKLGEALSEMVAAGEDKGWERLEIRHPLPRKLLSRDSPELGQRLESWETGIVVGTEQLEASGGEGSIEAALKKKKRRLSKAKKKGSVSLRNYDEKDGLQ